MSVSSYLLELIEAVAPPLVSHLRKTCAGFKITSPDENDVVPRGQRFRICGSFRFRCDYKLVVLHHFKDRYWPQEPVVIHDTKKTWECYVRVGGDIDGAHLVSVAAYSPDIEPLLEYFGKVGQKSEWQPIHLRTLPPGLKMLHSITVQPVE